MKDIMWDRIMLEEFRKLACITEDEDKILTAWSKGWSIVKMAMTFNIAERTVSRILDSIRAKYDAVEIFTPLLPARK